MFRGIAILVMVIQGIFPWGLCLCTAARAAETPRTSAPFTTCCTALKPIEEKAGCSGCPVRESDEGETPSPSCPCVSKRAAEQPLIHNRPQRLLSDGLSSCCAIIEVRVLETVSAGYADLMDAPWSRPWNTHTSRQALLAVWLN